MHNSTLSVLIGLLALGVGSCTPWQSFPPPVPTPVRNWTIVLSQSGGLAGVNLEVQVGSSGVITAKNVRHGLEITKPLAAPDQQELERLLGAVSLRGPGGAPSSCADCFLYDLEFTNLGVTTRWRGDDLTVAGSGAADLIRFLEELRDEALSGAS